MMVVTLKVTSAAFNYQDGLIEDEKNLRASQRSYRLSKLPSFLAFLGYCFNCGTHLAGPVFELKDYMDWTENEGVIITTFIPCQVLRFSKHSLIIGICMQGGMRWPPHDCKMTGTK